MRGPSGGECYFKRLLGEHDRHGGELIAGDDGLKVAALEPPIGRCVASRSAEGTHAVFSSPFQFHTDDQSFLAFTWNTWGTPMSLVSDNGGSATPYGTSLKTVSRDPLAGRLPCS